MDGDQRLDLVVVGDCFQIECPVGDSLIRLYRQQANHTFVDVTATSGLGNAEVEIKAWFHAGGVSAADIDIDGDVDLFLTYWTGGTRIYLNDGDGIFTDHSLSHPLASAPAQGIGPWQGLFHDFNHDHLPDLFVAVDFAPDRLMIQGPLGQFTDVAIQAQLDRAWNGMGIADGDIDNDGDVDLYVTNITDQFPEGARTSTFYRNDSQSSDWHFNDIGVALGVDDVGWGWGVVFADVDNNGWLDIAATNGFFTHQDASSLFMNSGEIPLRFTPALNSGFADTDFGSALLSIDVDGDGDGDLDVLQSTQDGPLRLLLNEHPSIGNWLTVVPRQEHGVHHAIGAEIIAESNSLTVRRFIRAGSSFMSQAPARAHFGLGANADRLNRLTVKWPDGRQSALGGVTVNQVVEVSDALIFVDGLE